MAQSRRQQRYKSAKNGCLRECVARATDRHKSRVPHFVRVHRGQWMDALYRWCQRVGYTLIVITKPRGVRTKVLEIHAERWINVGITRSGCGHAVYIGPTGIEYDGGQSLRRVDKVLFLVPSGSCRP